MNRIIISPDVKININKYEFMAPLISASLTSAVFSALSMKKPDETDEDVIHRVVDMWSNLTKTLEESASKSHP